MTDQQEPVQHVHCHGGIKIDLGQMARRVAERAAAQTTREDEE